MSRPHRLPAILAACLTALGASAAHSQGVTLSGLTQSPAPGPAGQEMFFSGTLTNTTANQITLGDAVIDFSGSGGADGAYLSQDLDDDYFNSVDGVFTLNPAGQTGSSYSGEIFAVTTDPATPPAQYTEGLTISDAFGNPITSQSVALSVAAPVPAPEPTSLPAFAVGAAVMTGFWLCRRVKRDSEEGAGGTAGVASID